MAQSSQTPIWLMKARLNSLSLPTRRQPVRQLRPVALDDRARISSEIASIRSKSSAVFVRPFEIGWHHDVAADASGRVDARSAICDEYGSIPHPLRPPYRLRR